MILVTGFKPFLGESLNPSEILLNEFKNFPHVETLLLPVEYEGSFNNLRIHLLQKFKFILMLGQAGGSAKIRLERVALNLEDSKSPDSSGVLRQDHRIESSGPAALFSKLPLNPWAQKIQEAGKDRDLGSSLEVSNHAGTFVCNSLYYKTLRHSTVPALFVHLPFLPEQVVAKAVGTPSMDLKLMKTAVESLLEIILSE